MTPLDSIEKNCISKAVGWVAASFFKGSRHELLVWVGPYLGDSAREMLKTHLSLDDPIRKRAEAKLIKFLGTVPTRPRNRRSMGSCISRNTDWMRSIMEHATGRPHTYWNRQVVHMPDVPLLSALVGIARLWWQELGSIGQSENNQYAERAQKLRRVCKRLSFTPLPVGYDTNMDAALRRCEGGEELADVLAKVRGLLWSVFKVEEDSSLLISLFEQADAEKISEEGKSNADAMLEVIATLALARTFCDLEWQPERQRLQQNWHFREGISLRKDNLVLNITKGFPPDIKDRTVNHLLTLRYKALGKQPDIVMRFQSDNPKKDPIYIIGDAKRNAAGNGNSYVRAAFFAMLGDFIAFGYAMNLELGKNPDDFFSGPICPSGILFFKKMNKQEPEQESENEPMIVGFPYEDYGHSFDSNSGQQGKDRHLRQLLGNIEKQIKTRFAGGVHENTMIES